MSLTEIFLVTENVEQSQTIRFTFFRGSKQRLTLLGEIFDVTRLTSGIISRLTSSAHAFSDRDDELCNDEEDEEINERCYFHTEQNEFFLWECQIIGWAHTLIQRKPRKKREMKFSTHYSISILIQ